jgi:hypothetical protein
MKSINKKKQAIKSQQKTFNVGELKKFEEKK